MMPRLSLRSCIRAYIVRDTVQAPLLEPAQRLNRFPASPLCSITWFMVGEAEMIEPPPQAPMQPIPIFFGGPRSGPIVSYNPGPVHALSVMFFPEALHRLAGLDVARCLDQFLLLEDVLPPDWCAMAQAMLHLPDDAARIAMLEDFLEPRWVALNGKEQAPAVAAEWARRLALQAAAFRYGNGVRNVERRIKAWAGQPMRTLRRMSRGEQSFLETRGHRDAGRGKLPWADIAASTGYADQAHFAREARAMTGLSPTELIRASDEDESYWIYRIWT